MARLPLPICMPWLKLTCAPSLAAVIKLKLFRTLDSSFRGCSLLVYRKTALRGIFHQHLCFCSHDGKIFLLMFLYWFIITNNNSGSHPNLRMYFVSLHMFRIRDHLNFNCSGDGYYPACINKLRCLS